MELLQQSIGEEQIEAFLRADNEIAATCLQVNTLLSDAQEAEQALTQLGIAFEKHPWLDGCYLVRGTGNLAQLEFFLRQGLCAGPVGKGAAMAAGAKPGMRVLDCCAAPGGKSFAQQLRCRTKGSVTSCDIHAHKVSLIEKGAARLGVSIVHARQADASQFEPEFEYGLRRGDRGRALLGARRDPQKAGYPI